MTVFRRNVIFIISTGLFIAVIATLFLVGWAVNNQFKHAQIQSSLDSITLTEQDHRREVSLAVGGILTLKLKCLPGTGYSWDIIRNNRDLLALHGEPQFEPIESKIPGGAEYQVFHFRALAAGTNVLELSYVRKWKKGTPLKTYRVYLLIR